MRPYPARGYRNADARRREAPPGFQSGGPPQGPPDAPTSLLDSILEAQYGRDALERALEVTERSRRWQGSGSLATTATAAGTRESRQALIKRLTGFARLHPALRAVNYVLDIQLSQQRADAAGQLMLPGQVLHKYCNWGDDGERPHRYQWGLPNLCIEGQAFGAGNALDAPYTVLELAADGASIWEDGLYFGATRSRTTEIYVWDNSLDAALATPGIKEYPWEMPVLDPRVAPMAQPIGKVTPVLQPMSKAAVKALAEATAANEGILPGLIERRMAGPSRVPSVQRYPQLSITSSMQRIRNRRRQRLTARLTWLKAIPRARPPGMRTKEKKWDLSKELLFLLGMPTELMDFIGAVYKALPEDLRGREKAKRHGKDPSPHAMLQILLANVRHISGSQAIYEVAKETVQDFAYAYASRRGVALNRSMGHSFGLDQNSTAKNYAQRFETERVEVVKHGALPRQARGGSYGLWSFYLYTPPVRRFQSSSSSVRGRASDVRRW